MAWKSRCLLEMLIRTSDLSPQSAHELKQTFAAAFDDAAFEHKLPQSRQTAHNAKGYKRPPTRMEMRYFCTKSYSKALLLAPRHLKNLAYSNTALSVSWSWLAKKAICVELPNSIRIHAVIQVKHTSLGCIQPSDISNKNPLQASPFINEQGELVFQVQRILSYRKRGRGIQFLALYKNVPVHKAEWELSHDSIDADCKITAALHEYIIENSILPFSPIIIDRERKSLSLIIMPAPNLNPNTVSLLVVFLIWSPGRHL